MSTLLRGTVESFNGKVGTVSVAGSKGLVTIDALHQFGFRPGYNEPEWVNLNGNRQFPSKGDSIFMLVAPTKEGYFAMKWGFYSGYAEAREVMRILRTQTEETYSTVLPRRRT